MTVFYYAFKRSIANKTNLFFLFLFPVILIFFPSAEYWPHLPYGYQYFGLFLMFISLKLTGLILEDRMRGVVKRLAVAPISHLRYLTQNLIAYFIILVIQCGILIGGGVLIGLELYQPFWLFILFVCFSLSAIGFSLMWISFFRSREMSMIIFVSVISLIAVLGGVMIPIELMPDVLQKVAIVFPTYWLAAGLDWVVFGDQGVKDFLAINGMLILFTILFLIIGSARKLR
ncbi:ABC transporter permease [Alkalihalobacillus pseudalcaliphilus]|uniref:ABC transporter permease n=1 Tax=Alkalihalobacillus pseudalcaliphilus TaxID=79884 RepID=UPI00064DCB74|nr:ABC transporter permease [Alkalihalobacillus pseudalcaliphilus]KMK77925.1 multidrug ABC transporter permease [Alkalihalobacillus pseudalcaliphilus]